MALGYAIARGTRNNVYIISMLYSRARAPEISPLRCSNKRLHEPGAEICSPTGSVVVLHRPLEIRRSRNNIVIPISRVTSDLILRRSNRVMFLYHAGWPISLSLSLFWAKNSPWISPNSIFLYASRQLHNQLSIFAHAFLHCYQMFTHWYRYLRKTSSETIGCPDFCPGAVPTLSRQFCDLEVIFSLCRWNKANQTCFERFVAKRSFFSTVPFI